MTNHTANQTLTKLYLIRHGQAYANVEPIIGGMKGDRGLTPLGVQQAEALRDRLRFSAELRPEVLIASTMPRAKQTAEIIAPALGSEIIFDDELHELRPGVADGMSIEEAHRLYSRVDFATHPFQEVDPGGESWASFVYRCTRALDRILREHQGKTIVLVTHGGLIGASFIYFFKLSGASLPPVGFYTHNTAITWWEQHTRFEQAQWRLRKYNDDAHLTTLGYGENIDWERPKVMAEASEPASEVPTEPEKDGAQ